MSLCDVFIVDLSSFISKEVRTQNIGTSVRTHYGEGLCTGSTHASSSVTKGI